MIREVIPDSEWALTAASLLATWVAENSPARVCLPTGKTVEPLYGEVINLTEFDDVELFLLDEFGGLPSGDAGRCETMLRRYLLDHLDPAPLFHFPNVDALDLDLEARRYEQLVGSRGLDLAVVGLGANGHIGMNEPGSTPDSRTRVVDLATTTTNHAAVYGASTPPNWGITIGLGTLMATKEIWLMVTGSDKSDILARTLNENISSDVPATFLRSHPGLTVLADESAFG